MRQEPITEQILYINHLDAVVKTLLHGLNSDGAHHKQDALETALRLLCEDSWVDEAKEHLQWEATE